jgi:ABC-type glutathione transport system ATPase component
MKNTATIVQTESSQSTASHAAGATSPDKLTPNFSVFNAKANRKIHQEFVIQQEHYRAYISDLENLLIERGIEIPEDIHEHKKHAEARKIMGRGRKVSGLMEDGSFSALSKAVERTAEHAHRYEIHVQYRNLTFWNMVAKKHIPTVGSSLLGMVMGSGKKYRVNIINDLTGRILPKRMTLVMGPPGCGKTTFLKALAGQLTVGKAHLEGDILYNGDSTTSGKYLIGKVATYADEKEQHAPTLTVRETMEFAWKMTTGGHHSYGVARDKTSAEFLDKNDKELVLVS